MADSFTPAQTRFVCALVKNLKSLGVRLESPACPDILPTSSLNYRELTSTPGRNSAKRTYHLLKESKGSGEPPISKRRKMDEDGEDEAASLAPKKRGRKPKAKRAAENGVTGGEEGQEIKPEPYEAA